MIRLYNVQAVVTDIEGTVSSLAYVEETLFPYARRFLPEYVRENEWQLADILAEVASLARINRPELNELIDVLLRWMDADVKLTPLKALQGMIWRSGFENGNLIGHVYEDAVRVLRAWYTVGFRIHIYSSGSVEAQKLLFAHTAHGDMTSLFAGYFDTTVGQKTESSSYQSILHSLSLDADCVVFLSDHAEEIRAAAGAGMQTVLFARHEKTARGVKEECARSFDDIGLQGWR